MTRTSLTIGLVCLGSVVLAQDPVQVDPKHYRVEFENAQVRVLHIQYGPHEKSVPPSRERRRQAARRDPRRNEGRRVRGEATPVAGV
ncbi:MAG: hypothetical protein E6J68_09630 [Deltaproteobacteria bacterium]|nr:MAG: hypothetical protein E6J68_09630 [Deltaproteobacteria bacterium]